MSSQKKLRSTPEGWSRFEPPSSSCLVNAKPFKKFDFLSLPPHLQRLILGSVPLRHLAQLACMNKELRAVYLERINERDAAVAALLESQFTAEFREGLSPAETALLRDMIVDPPMSTLLQAAPDKCVSLAQSWQSREGQYQGFCIAGRPDGRGECRFSVGNTFLGDWQRGLPHGQGTQFSANRRVYVGDFSEGMRQGQGTLTWSTGEKYEGSFLNNCLMGKADTRGRVGKYMLASG